MNLDPGRRVSGPGTDADGGQQNWQIQRNGASAGHSARRDELPRNATTRKGVRGGDPKITIGVREGTSRVTIDLYNAVFMSGLLNRIISALYILAFLLAAQWAGASSRASCIGSLRDESGRAIAGAIVHLRSAAGDDGYRATSSVDGKFTFSDIPAGAYAASVTVGTEEVTSESKLVIREGEASAMRLELSAGHLSALIESAQREATPGGTAAQGSGGEHLSSAEVSSLPLNARDFSKLLLLAAGTMTDANGAANFTQQFAVNGQRGVTTIFAMYGFDTTDPEMGGATFSNFNVDAIQEVESNSGVLPAEVGHGAASYTNVITKFGVTQIHGSMFEFQRNASLDARNYFDHNSGLDLRRIPPFARNEFGFTNGGPIVLPGIYDGRNRTFYFGEYQGFRQVLGTTQVFPVPTKAERQGIDTTSFPGDTLNVPIDPAIVPVI